MNPYMVLQSILAGELLATVVALERSLAWNVRVISVTQGICIATNMAR